MRGYECHYFRKLANGEFEQPYRTACWGSLRRVHETKEEFIYIDVKDIQCNNELRKILLPIINKITYCKKVTKNPFYKDKYIIKYKPIYNDKGESDFYYRNMFLLNFVRYIWNEPVADLSEDFRKELLKVQDEKDPIITLTIANQASYKDRNGYDINGDHSNAFKKAKVKTLKEFNDKTFVSIQNFLTS